MMTETLLACSNISFAYPRRAVLDGISLTIRGNDFVGVIGPNGAGKTTLIRILAGLLHPSAGVVFLEGRDIKSVPRNAVASHVAVVQQEETPDFGFPVMEHVTLGRAPHHGGLYFETIADRRIVGKSMEKARVAHLADRLMDALSGGERQRVRIARALAQQPRVLLLDEPTNHLDLYSQLSLVELLRGINDEGIAILMVSHDINFVSACCAHVKILHEGKFRSEGSPHEVITEKNLAESFHIRALVDKNPATAAPRMTPLARLDRDR